MRGSGGSLATGRGGGVPALPAETRGGSSATTLTASSKQIGNASRFMCGEEADSYLCPEGFKRSLQKVRCREEPPVPLRVVPVRAVQRLRRARREASAANRPCWQRVRGQSPGQARCRWHLR